MNKKNVKGIMLLIEEKIHKTKHKKPIDDLDSLPFPIIDKLPFRKYNMWIRKKTPVHSLNTSRGCPHGCIFCHHSLGYKYRARSPENVIREIIYLKKKGINEIWIADDSFTQIPKRAEKIFDLIIKNKINISINLQNGIRADTIDENLIIKMKKAGVWLVSIAPEVGTNESLKKINKQFSLNDVKNAVRLLKKYNIATLGLYIIGFPWEGHKEISNTINFSKELDTDLINVSRLNPYPGTPIWNMINSHDISLIDEKKTYKDSRYKHPTLSEKQIQSYIKKMNKEFYTPKKLYNLLKKLGIGPFSAMAYYSIKSKSI